MAQYKAQLTAGYRALFARDADYQMRVYPSVRAAFLPDTVNAAPPENATTASLEGTDRPSGARLGVPSTRKRVVQGKSVSVRVALGGSSLMKTHTQTTQEHSHNST